MLCKKIRSFIKKYGMPDNTEKIAVAFSGGADSLALLHFLKNEGYNISAIHINHGIRGDEADGDEDFCRDFCQKNSIPFYCSRVNVPGAAKEMGIGLEEAARKIRYGEIERIIKEESINTVATAHHADDNMETLIFNITRGSSLKGARAIPPVRGRNIRPLIECTREEITEYCEKNSLEYVTDSTNLSTDYTRNFIRHKISPLIKQINPDAPGAFSRFCASARRDEDFIQGMAAKLPENIKRSELSSLHPALLTRYIYREADKFGVTPSQKAAELLISAIRMGNEYKVVDMGYNLKAVCDRDTLRFEKESFCKEEQKELVLQMGENDLFEMGKLYLTDDEEIFKEFCNIYKISSHTRLCYDKIKGNLYIRCRKNGDRYRYGGITRSLKKLLCEKKLSVMQRDMLPIVCDESGIAWVPSFPVRDDLKVKEEKIKIFIGYAGKENDIEQ